ncbi:hypothetical protein AB9U01_09330 [Pseudomonas qingdaonensis]|uniref:hypothetical protein n=1 Tax=Pseudomonas qingdaonensis TaxID=2056231 RepID=UPI0035115396
MDTNKMRGQFEQWAKDRYSWHLHDDARDPEDRTLASWNGETYGNRIVEGMWQTWQASREAVVVELPQVVAYEAGYDSLRDNEYAGLPDRLPDFDYDELFELHRSDEVRAAIEAQGLKVAP